MAHRDIAEELARLSPRDFVAVAIWGEARGEPIEGQVAVANVIRNRVRKTKTSYHEVLGRWAQFSALWPRAGLNYQSVLGFAATLMRQVAGGMQELNAIEVQIVWLATGLLTNAYLDNTHGSTHYFNYHMIQPYWAKKPGVRMVTYGRHEFWAGVA